MRIIVNIAILGIIAALTGCSGRPQIEKGVNYPDMISPIYYLDTFQIQKPLVVYINSIPYITSEEVFNRVTDKTNLPKTRGVIRYLTSVHTSNRAYTYLCIYKVPNRFFNQPFEILQSQNNYAFFGRNLKLIDSVQGVAVYRFDRKPRTFLLTLITTEEYEDRLGDIIEKVEYSNDYMFAIAPLFSKKDRRALHFKCLHT